MKSDNAGREPLYTTGYVLLISRYHIRYHFRETNNKLIHGKYHAARFSWMFYYWPFFGQCQLCYCHFKSSCPVADFPPSVMALNTD